MGIADINRADLPAGTGCGPEKLETRPVLQLLTASRMRAFRDCARLEYIRYVERWQPVKESEALRVGTLIHLGLEQWLAARFDGHPDEAFDRAIAAVAGRAIDAYEQARVEEMLWGYDLRWHGEPLEVFAVESEFRGPLLNPETMAASRTWEQAGKIDGVIRAPDGRLLVMEHKTASEEIDDAASPYWLKLQMDHQVSIYFLGAEVLGYRVEGCLYDVLRKPGLRPFKATAPELRKYTKDGRLYASQHGNDETPDEYRARLRAEIEGNLDRYYVRREVPRLSSQLEAAMQDFWTTASVMRDLHRAGETKGRHVVPGNPDACHRFGTCPYFEICAAGLDPAATPDRFKRAGSAHPELSPEIVS